MLASEDAGIEDIGRPVIRMGHLGEAVLPQIQIVSPMDGTQITSQGVKEGALFSFLFSKSNVPVRLRMANPTNQVLNFTLSFYWTETAQDPSAGSTSVENGNEAFAVSLKPNEIRDQDFKLFLLTGQWWAIDMATRLWVFVPGIPPLQVGAMNIKVV